MLVKLQKAQAHLLRDAHMATTPREAFVPSPKLAITAVSRVSADN